MSKNYNFKDLSERLKFSRLVAEEGIVLLKNEDNILPLRSKRIAVFGGAQLGAQTATDGVKVDLENSVGITEALIRSGYEIDEELYNSYVEWRKGFIGRQYGEWCLSHSSPEMDMPLEVVQKTKQKGAETAFIVIRRSSYENSDMDIEIGDYILGDTEIEMIKNVCAVYSDVILLLHIGCNIDLGFLDEVNIKGILYLNQLGVNGALGMADIITGKVNPSGRLTVSLAKHFEDYPSSPNFGQHGGGLLQDYKEDIYVGYRYFETFKGADKNLVYPFGFGLSYTDFEITDIDFVQDGKDISVSATVTNTGDAAGKQVLQLYYTYPEIEDGALLGAPKKQLCGYEKTKLLGVGESQRITIELNADDMAAFDDLGVLGEKDCFVMEKGSYKLLLGTDSRNTDIVGEYIEEETRITERCHHIKTTLTERLNRRGEYDKLPQPEGEDRYYGISSMGCTELDPCICNNREITSFSQLKKGETASYKLLPGTGGGFKVYFKGNFEGKKITDCVEICIDGVAVKNDSLTDDTTIEITLPLERCVMTLTPFFDNVNIEAVIFEKIDAKIFVSATEETFIKISDMYECSFCVSLENFEDDGFGNSGSFMTGINTSGRYANYKLDVEEGGLYDIQFKYAFCDEPRPINSVITILASNIVQPLGGVMLEKTYNEGEARIFGLSEKCKITLPKGSVYLKLASENIPFPDICGIALTKSDGEITATDIDEESIRERNSSYCGIERRKLIDDPALFPKIGIQFKDVYKNPELMRPFLEQLSNRELATIVSGTTNNLTVGGDVGCNSPVHERGIPAAQTADGPCGLRQFDQLPIAFPTGMVLAASFNKELYEQFGHCIAHECLHYDVDYMLGPSLNILRSPAGGRNCSYFSEDPYVCGIATSYYIKGLQADGISAVMKHYAANNTEFERLKSNSRVSARALREIYLKGFEMACKLSDPWAIMSSYNHVNDIKACEDYTLITEIPREEWGWNGVFFTDWWNDSRHVDEVKAGHDLKMSTGDVDGVTEALDNGELTREQVYICAERMIKMLMKLGRIKRQLEAEE